MTPPPPQPRSTPDGPEPREDPGRETAYAAYLALDRLLTLQTPKTDQPDEALFVIVHQAHELWFKELIAILADLHHDLEEGRTGPALRGLHRTLRILRVLDAHLDVLETMTPARFHSFRDELGSASGFASAQFRVLEVVLGRRDLGVLRGFPPGSGERRHVEDALGRPPLFDALVAYLDRHGHTAPASGSPAQDDGTELAAGTAAVTSAYAEDGSAAQVCEAFVDLDEAVQHWRFRHMAMARRLIGSRAGTSGSSGVDYLRSTVARVAFPPLWAGRDAA